MDLYIVTLDELKQELGLSDTTDDAKLQRLLYALQGRFETHCRRGFEYSAAVTEIHGGGATCLYVWRYPIASITSIEVDADQTWGDAEDLLDSDDYLLDHEEGRIIYGRGTTTWPAGVKNVRVIYAGGLVKNDTSLAHSHCEEADRSALRRAMLMQGGYEWRQRLNMGAQSVSAQGGSVNLAPARLLPEVLEALAPLRRMTR